MSHTIFAKKKDFVKKKQKTKPAWGGGRCPLYSDPFRVCFFFFVGGLLNTKMFGETSGRRK
jgi:hypothetical protein